VPTLPSRWLKAPDERLELGGVVFEFKHRGGAHTPGDTMVWLPQKNVLFTGDVVYVDRLLGVMPGQQHQELAGHLLGDRTAQARRAGARPRPRDDLATARADTQAYLLALRAHMKKAVDDGVT
jgi:glyoxylase-like metal-dependent hydrolase (beta-lactamase superfamily II)